MYLERIRAGASSGHGQPNIGDSIPTRDSYINYTSSTAQGGGGSFKNRKRIGDWLL